MNAIIFISHVNCGLLCQFSHRDSYFSTLNKWFQKRTYILARLNLVISYLQDFNKFALEVFTNMNFVEFNVRYCAVVYRIRSHNTHQNT